MPRIAVIHALRHSIAPVMAAFAALWPEAYATNLLDDSLSSDLEMADGLTPAMTVRFLALTRYAVETGASAILFTCSAFGSCVDACAAAFPDIPVLKPNEAMVAEASARGGRIALLATFAPTLVSMPAEFPPGAAVVPVHVAGALAALERGDAGEHNRLIAASAAAMRSCDVIALAQFSMARAAGAVAEATGLPVLTTPTSAVGKLKSLLQV